MAAPTHTPMPWDLVPSNEHHGPYLVGPSGGDIADFYVMSKPDWPSTLNGGPSKPIHHMGEEADANAALVFRLVTLYGAGRAMIARQAADIRARGMIPADGAYGLTENETAAAMMMNGMLDRYEALDTALRAARGAIKDDGSHAVHMLLKIIDDALESASETKATA